MSAFFLQIIILIGCASLVTLAALWLAERDSF